MKLTGHGFYSISPSTANSEARPIEVALLIIVHKLQKEIQIAPKLWHIIPQKMKTLGNSKLFPNFLKI